MRECNCLDKIRKKLSEHHGSNIELDLKTTINLSSGKMGADLPPLGYRYAIGKKFKKSYVTFNFCPFCGK
jgi:hypothetical protein